MKIREDFDGIKYKYIAMKYILELLMSYTLRHDWDSDLTICLNADGSGNVRLYEDPTSSVFYFISIEELEQKLLD
jgi:hypothetical protein